MRMVDPVSARWEARHPVSLRTLCDASSGCNRASISVGRLRRLSGSSCCRMYYPFFDLFSSAAGPPMLPDPHAVRCVLGEDSYGKDRL